MRNLIVETRNEHIDILQMQIFKVFPTTECRCFKCATYESRVESGKEEEEKIGNQLNFAADVGKFSSSSIEN